MDFNKQTNMVGRRKLLLLSLLAYMLLHHIVAATNTVPSSTHAVAVRIQDWELGLELPTPGSEISGDFRGGTKRVGFGEAERPWCTLMA